MRPKNIHSIVNSIVTHKPNVGSYFVLTGQLVFTDYNIRISYRNYLKSIQKLQSLEIEGTVPQIGISMEALTEAKFFFESIYWFVFAIEKVTKQNGQDEMVKVLKSVFKKYKHLKMPRVNISKDNFSKLIKADTYIISPKLDNV